MRILLIFMDYPPRMAGGTSVHIRSLAIALSRIGHEVHVLSADSTAPKEEILDGIHVHRVRRPFTLFSATAAKNLLPRVDVVHGQGICTFGHLLLNDFPTVVKIHGTWLEERRRYLELQNPNAGKRMDAVFMMDMYGRMDRFCVRACNHIICVSEAVRGEVHNYGIAPEKTSVIYNGLDAQLFETEEDVREELNLKGNVVLYAGRLEPHKGVEFLIRACRDLDAALLIVGKGSDSSRLSSLVDSLGMSGRTTFVGEVPHEQIARYYNTADVVVYPTLYEPLGNVVLESMASGKPIVASRTGGIPEILNDECGILVSPADEKELHRALDTLLNDESLRKEMGASGRNAVKKYSWENVARKTASICRDVIDSMT